MRQRLRRQGTLGPDPPASISPKNAQSEHKPLALPDDMALRELRKAYAKVDLKLRQHTEWSDTMAKLEEERAWLEREIAKKENEQ
jgi:hypothetical protein